MIFLVLPLLWSALGGTEAYVMKSAGLTTIPTNIPPGTSKVDLAQNELTTVTNTSFSHLTELKTLLLKSNDISQISPDAFNNNPITLLDLKYNPIKIVPYFQALENSLETLLMDGCSISNATWDNVISYTTLTKLSLASNQIYVIPDMSTSAQTLTSLDLNSNIIEVLNATALNVLRNLYLLDIRKNNMHIIYGTLDLPKLGRLKLSTNAMKVAPNMSLLLQLEWSHLQGNLIKEMADNTLHNPLLTELVMNMNSLTKIPKLDNACQSLQYLDLNKNEITSIPDGHFESCVKLVKLHLNSNQITSISWAKSLGPSVMTLKVSNCKIMGMVPADTFVNATGMVTLSLYKNNISGFDLSNLKSMPHLRSLDLTDNALTELLSPYNFCPGSAYENLTITATGNTIPCDGRLCWAKATSKINLIADNCLGKTWNSITLSDMNCQGVEVFQTYNRHGAAIYFKGHTLLRDDLVKLRVTSDLFLECAAKCLKVTDCQFFKYEKSGTMSDATCTLWISI